MKNFSCHCGNTIYFENTKCIDCERLLGYLPDYRVMSAFEPAGGHLWRALAPAAAGGIYRMCNNYRNENVCNWMIPQTEADPFCQSCRLNLVIPNLNIAKNRQLWYRIEEAKRRLLFNLTSLGLSVVGKQEDPDRGLAFQFLEDTKSASEFSDEIIPTHRVMTGHRKGVITINLEEADDSTRERNREMFNEPYRTLLGHFRHEVGHYYWDRMIPNAGRIEKFRVLFGDEREDYPKALERYYTTGTPDFWYNTYISAYASAHPWEDWAETWAHYLHMTATLETAHEHGFTINGRQVRPPSATRADPIQTVAGYFSQSLGFEDLLKDWERLTLAMNALNRSMGMPDAYPFVLSAKAKEKLYFVHELIAATRAGP
jgi:hypothetical protein